MRKQEMIEDNLSISEGSEAINKNTNSQSRKKVFFPYTALWRWVKSDKTMFDWLGVVAVPLAVALVGGAVGFQQLWITQDNQRSELMSKYYERMQGLLITEKMGQPLTDKRVSVMGSALTLSTFRQLDGERKGELIKFLHQANLIAPRCDQLPNSTEKECAEPIIDLTGARLGRTKFESGESIILEGVDLEKVSLKEAYLSGIQLSKSKMAGVILDAADLTNAFLNEASMQSSKLRYTKLVNAKLYRSSLINALLTNADLAKATLKEADLRGADLTNANLTGADLTGAFYDENYGKYEGTKIDAKYKKDMRLCPVGVKKLEDCDQVPKP